MVNKDSHLVKMQRINDDGVLRPKCNIAITALLPRLKEYCREGKEALQESKFPEDFAAK